MFKITQHVRSVLQLLAIAAVVWLLYTVRGLLVYIVIAGLISLLTKPFTNWLSSRKIGRFFLPRSLSALVTLLLIISFFVLITRILFPVLIDEFAVLQSIDFQAAYVSLLEEVDSAQKWLEQYNVRLNQGEGGFQDAIASLFSLKTAEATLTALLGGLGNLAIAIFSILFILFFFLREKFLMEYLLTNLVSDNLAGHLRNILPKIKTTIFRYSVGLTFQMTGIFILVYFGLKLVGVQSAMLIAAFAAFINLIPYIGPMIGAAFGLVLGLGQAYALDPTMHFGLLAGEMALVFAITQLTDNFVFQPLIFSNSINAHPLEIFIVISIAGLLGGILGMVIAVPGYSMLRIISKEFLSNSKFIQGLTKNV